MILIPAIDLYEGKAVRLRKGDYAQMTIYSEHPIEVAKQFSVAGAEYLHLVDLEGAKSGTMPNLEVVRAIAAQCGMPVEIGGGIRSEQNIQTYLQAGVDRVILGTVALEQPEFLQEMVEKYDSHIAVGVDIRDGMVATHGWTKTSEESCFAFCERLEKMGVQTIICTDISKDGMMAGTNEALYAQLSRQFSMNIVASGGVSSLEDVRNLAAMGLYGAIAGKALYQGELDLVQAIACARGEEL